MARTQLSYSHLDRLGETKITNEGFLIKIIDYKNSSDITIQFEGGHTKKVSYQNFVNGEVKNPLYKSVYNIGFLGIGDYKRSSKAGQLWNSIIDRCYNSQHIENRCYIDCTIHPEWHNFQNFAKWFEENFDPIKHKNFHLDKDLLVRGNKIYGPDTCCFVPGEINTLLSNQNRNRNLPTGVFKVSKGYKVCININKELIKLGVYNTVEEAEKVFKDKKSEVIQNLAVKYKDFIVQKVYNILINYNL